MHCAGSVSLDSQERGRGSEGEAATQTDRPRDTERQTDLSAESSGRCTAGHKWHEAKEEALDALAEEKLGPQPKLLTTHVGGKTGAGGLSLGGFKKGGLGGRNSRKRKPGLSLELPAAKAGKYREDPGKTVSSPSEAGLARLSSATQEVCLVLDLSLPCP